MAADKISLDSAKKDKLFYFVANVVVRRPTDGRFLVLKRDPREKCHGGKFGVIGGKLEWKDLDIKNPTRVNGDVLDFENALEDLLRREASEEAGIEIGDKLKYLNSVAYVRPDGVPTMMIKVVAEYVSGEVVPEKGGFTEFAWVNAEEIKNYDCIEGIKEEVLAATKLF